jgi:hypothetical protein
VRRHGFIRAGSISCADALLSCSGKVEEPFLKKIGIGPQETKKAPSAHRRKVASCKGARVRRAPIQARLTQTPLQRLRVW